MVGALLISRPNLSLKVIERKKLLRPSHPLKRAFVTDHWVQWLELDDVTPKSSLVDFEFPPIRVPCLVGWNQNKIIESNDNGLLAIRSQIKMDVFPVTI